MLSHRARRILLAAVGDFIATGEPVASRSLAERHDFDLSPASIRAVLAELEAGGYLLKPHTSAGRVPTEQGIKVFADAMVSSASERAFSRDDELDRRYSSVDPGIDALLRHTGRVLADMTGSAALVRPPRGETWVLRELRFIWLRAGEVLAVIVSTNGAVQNRALRVEGAPSAVEIERMNNLLRARIEGRTLAEVRSTLARELEEARMQRDRLALRALEIGQQALAVVTPEEDLVVEGTAQLLDRPEFASADRTRQLVRTLDDQEKLLLLLDRTLQTPGIQVVIGTPDNEVGSALSLVTACFGSGVLGVLGSTRMDYSQVVPLVRQTALKLTRLLRERDGGRNRN